MKQPSIRESGLLFTRKRTLIALTCVLIALASITIMLYPREKTLNGLLVDLELRGPDPVRYSELVEVLTRRLQSEVPAAKNVRIELQYIHYPEFTSELVKRQRPDFILLSPQNTPWYMYREDAGIKLEAAKAVVKNLTLKERLPVLGICGGHQFLAMVFGGTIDFIDSRLVGVFPEKYPTKAVSERGLVDLETLRSDPIFAGVATHPGRFKVMESHYEEVKTIPELFVNLARSQMSEVQLIRIPGLMVYGMAFHPERSGNLPGSECSDGRIMLGNFIRMVAEGGR